MKFFQCVAFLLLLTGCASFRNSAPIKFINDRFGTPTSEDITPESMRERYVKENPNLAQPIKEAILEGHIVKGMSKKDATSVMGNPATIESHETSTMQVATWNYCFGSTIMAIDFSGDTVVEFESRTGESNIYNCKDASREMWIMRRGRDTGK